MSPDELFDTVLNGDPIDALTAISALRDLINDTEYSHVMTLRRHGATWTFIARHFGITRQAIQKKYGTYDPQQR